jgi:glutamine synthetase
MTPKEAVELAKKHDVKYVDLKFIDFPGVWQHTTIPVARLEESLFEDGIAFDGSSIRGWQPINASDMVMIPDSSTAKIDPFYATPTLSVICSIFDPITKQPYSRDPRHIAKKAEAYLRQTGIGDTSYMGPEAEFFVFDDVRFDQSQPKRRRSVEQRPRRVPEPGLQDAAQGRLLPGSTDRHARGPASDHHDDAAGNGRRSRSGPPRSLLRRPV